MVNPTNLNLQDVNTQITSKLIYSCLNDEINGILNSYNSCGICSIRSKTINNFIEKLKASHLNILSKKTNILQDLFLLHHICKAFYIYNNSYLGLTHQEFRSKVLYPNLVYMLVRHFHSANMFLKNTIKNVYNEISRSHYGMIKRYTQSYYLDENIIKIEVLYEFLGNLLKKLDPLEVENLDYFYKQVFRNIFNYYFKSEEKNKFKPTSIWNLEKEVTYLKNNPTRLSTYRDTLYKLQIKSYSSKSPVLDQFIYNYNIFKNVILNNEFQNMYFSCKTDTFMVNDNQYKILKIYNNNLNKVDDELLEKIKKLPIIFKLLKCVRIINPKSKPYNEMNIKPDHIKTVVLDQLLINFRNVFNDTHCYSILEKIAENFTNSILSGEYINLFTLSTFKINHISFISQIKEFVNICITEGLNVTEYNTK